MHRWMWIPVLTGVACAPDPEVQTLANGVEREYGAPSGCWAVETGSWATTHEAAIAFGSASDSDSVRWILRFDTLPPPITSPDRLDARTAETFLEGAWRDFPFQRWWMTGDSMFIDHPAAFSGTTLQLVARDNGFTGIAMAHTDVQMPGETRYRYAPAKLRRTDCPE